MPRELTPQQLVVGLILADGDLRGLLSANGVGSNALEQALGRARAQSPSPLDSIPTQRSSGKSGVYTAEELTALLEARRGSRLGRNMRRWLKGT